MVKGLPQNVLEISRKVHVPALRKARQKEGAKVTIIGDRLLVNCKSYSFESFDRIPIKLQEVASDEEMYRTTSALQDEVPEHGLWLSTLRTNRCGQNGF